MPSLSLPAPSWTVSLRHFGNQSLTAVFLELIMRDDKGMNKGMDITECDDFDTERKCSYKGFFEGTARACISLISVVSDAHVLRR